MPIQNGNRRHYLATATLRMLAWPFGNSIGQRALAALAKGILFMMGVGAGAGVRTSGERHVLLMARRNLHSGERVVVFDVGASSGDYISIAAESRGLQPFVVHAFEPSAVAFERLMSRWGSRDDVVLNRLAVSNTSGTRVLYANAPGSTLASLTKRDLRHIDLTVNHSEQVTVETLDNYCLAKGIQRIDLLKVDVEGHELEVFQGAIRLLRNGAVRITTFEFGGTHIDSRVYLRDLFYFFHDHAMDLYRITPSGYVAKIARYSEFYEQFRTTNFVAMNRNI